MESTRNAWPSRPIRLITLSRFGEATDQALRTLTPALSRTLGQAMIVENRAQTEWDITQEILLGVLREINLGCTFVVVAREHHHGLLQQFDILISLDRRPTPTNACPETIEPCDMLFLAAPGLSETIKSSLYTAMLNSVMSSSRGFMKVTPNFVEISAKVQDS